MLRECTADLWLGILSEARRLLKPNGKLIILEWDKQSKLSRKLKFAPLYAIKVMGNIMYFRQFYYSDKNKFFEKHGFKVVDNIKCNYTSVISIVRL